MSVAITVETLRGGRVVGCQRFDGRVQRFIKIGRMASATIVVDDPDASRLHAIVELTGRIATLRDLGTISGTKLNGHRVDSAVLSDGDEIIVGGTILRIGVTGEDATAVSARVGWATATAQLSGEWQLELELFLEFLRFKQDRNGPHPVPPVDRSSTLPELPSPTPVLLEPTAERDAFEAMVTRAQRPDSDAHAMAIVPLVEKYDTRRLVAQMKQQKRRSYLGVTLLLAGAVAGVVALAPTNSQVMPEMNRPIPSRRVTQVQPPPILQSVPEPDDKTSSDASASEAEPEPRPPRLLRYTVQPGDSLSGIALGLLGDTGHAEAIFEANRDTLVDPERIEIGMVLKIPIAAMP